MKKQAMNPYLPICEYIPDGEPHVFDGRIYIYGSHDVPGVPFYCPGDYEVWSAPENDLADWRKDGVIFPRKSTVNPTGERCLWAPDVCRGADGRYYLYFCFDLENCIHAAVCETPAGRYEYLGIVHHPDGTAYGHAAGDHYCFDPAVFCDDDGTFWLYSGSSPTREMLENSSIREGRSNLDGTGSQVMRLDADMLTILEAPKMLLPGWKNSRGTGFEGHEFFEASSMRKVDGKYYFIYSSILSHELCYAVSDHPDRGFTFGGTIISNADIGFRGRPVEAALNDWGNNHGSIEKINGQWYVFYHRQTNRNEQSRQGCAEPIEIVDGKISQVEMTSQGLSGTPLPGIGTYPAHIACNLYAKSGARKCGYGDSGKVRYPAHPCITQEPVYGLERQMICNMRSGSTAGFKYFCFDHLRRITLTVRGSGTLLISLTPDGTPIAVAELPGGKDWKPVIADTRCVSGVHPLYIRYRGRAHADILDVTLE